MRLLGAAFKVVNGVSYYELNGEFFAVGVDPKFCFSDRSLPDLEKKIEKGLIFSKQAATNPNTDTTIYFME